MATPKFPDVEVKLTGSDASAISIMMNVKRALRKGGASTAECEEFMSEAMSGDYDNVLVTAMNWVNVL
jgi:hypothetical protein